MTRLKAALVNAVLLGMNFGIERDVVSMTEDAPDVFVGTAVEIHATSVLARVANAQEACGKRYCQQSSEIQRRLMMDLPILGLN